MLLLCLICFEGKFCFSGKVYSPVAVKMKIVRQVLLMTRVLDDIVLINSISLTIY